MSSEEQNNNQALQKGGSSQPPSMFREKDLTLMREFVQLQREQVEVRKEEIEIQKQEVANKSKQLDNTHEYAKLSLNAQAEDLKDHRIHLKTERRDKMIGAGVVISVLAIVLLTLVYMGQAELAKQIGSYIGLLIVGAYGGYNYGLRKGKEREEQDK